MPLRIRPCFAHSDRELQHLRNSLQRQLCLGQKASVIPELVSDQVPWQGGPAAPESDKPLGYVEKPECTLYLKPNRAAATIRELQRFAPAIPKATALQ